MLMCFMEAACCVHVPCVHCCWYLLVQVVGKAIVCIRTCIDILAVNTNRAYKPFLRLSSYSPW